LNWNSWVRQIHRWVSAAFTVLVVVNVIAFARGTHADWLGLMAAAPLALLLPTGIYLFALPYASRRRSRRGGEAE
jgi:hypothetical protein